MRRSLASRAIAFTSASVGLRKVSRSVSRTQGQASRKWVGGGISCNMVGSVSINALNEKREAGFPPPLGASKNSAGSTGPGGIELIHRYSAAASVIGRTDTNVRPLALA